jgi:Ca2+-binding RTX toxin-like protein
MTTTTPSIRLTLVLATAIAAMLLALTPASSPAYPVLNLFQCSSSPNVVGTAGPETLVGTAAADGIRGYGGDDFAIGNGGNDNICLDDGADSASGGPGNDLIRGGPGNDHAITGNEGDDWIFGDAGNDSLGAHPGKDSVFGGTGNDVLYGDTWPAGDNDPTDADHLYGGDGFDTCYPGWEDVVSSCEKVVWPQQPPA